MVRPVTLGTGEVRSDESKPIIHFGSPAGASYAEDDETHDSEEAGR